MANYDRSAQKQEKKGKKGKKGGQPQPARKRKHYSIFIPVRKVARTLASSGAEFVGRQAFEESKVAQSNDVRGALNSLADNGCHGEYGEATQALAKKAQEHFEKLELEALK